MTASASPAPPRPRCHPRSPHPTRDVPCRQASYSRRFTRDEPLLQAASERRRCGVQALPGLLQAQQLLGAGMLFVIGPEPAPEAGPPVAAAHAAA